MTELRSGEVGLKIKSEVALALIAIMGAKIILLNTTVLGSIHMFLVSSATFVFKLNSF